MNSINKVEKTAEVEKMFQNIHTIWSIPSVHKLESVSNARSNMVLRMYIMISQSRRLMTLLKAGQNSGGGGGGNATVGGRWMAEETKQVHFYWGYSTG